MIQSLLSEVRACTICAAHLPFPPRPMIQAGRSARILVIGQAPGSKVQEVGIPWADASGERLREWTGIPSSTFYDPDQVALMPMGLCYPGRGKSGDLPPRKECAPAWHDRVLAELPMLQLKILVGQYAQARYAEDLLGPNMTETVRNFEAFAARGMFPLPHPSWRSTMWLRKNPWFELEAVPLLRTKVDMALAAD